MTRPEAKLLVQAADLRGQVALDADFTRFDQAFFLDAAYRHRVAALVGASLSAAEVFTPDSRLEYVEDALLAARLLNERKNRVLLTTAAELTQTLAEAGVAYAVRKGAYLTPAVYGDPGLRPMSDIDIFVAPTASREVTEILKQAGFRQGNVAADGTIRPPTRREEVFWKVHVNNLPTFHRPCADPLLGVVSVDICVDLFLPATGCRLPAAGLLSNLRTFDLAGTAATTFGAEHFVLDVAAHLYKESTTLRYIERGKHQRLLQYVDLVAMLSREREFDWDSLLTMSIEAGAARNLYYALANAEQLFSGTVPASALDRLAAAGDVDESFLLEYGAVDLAEPLSWSSSSLLDRLFWNERAAVASKSPI